MHFDQTCTDYKVDKVNKADDTDVINMIKNVIKAKQCTKCKFWVEKNEGCNHMTCRCGY
jgi:E3 ubiquitin-protein ligase RNF144